MEHVGHFGPGRGAEGDRPIKSTCSQVACCSRTVTLKRDPRELTEEAPARNRNVAPLQRLAAEGADSGEGCTRSIGSQRLSRTPLLMAVAQLKGPASILGRDPEQQHGTDSDTA